MSCLGILWFVLNLYKKTDQNQDVFKGLKRQVKILRKIISEPPMGVEIMTFQKYRLDM